MEAVSPELGNRVQRVRVQLPGTSPELLNKFRDKKVDFAAHTATEDGGAVFLNLIGNLAFPLLLVGGLFLLSRRSQVWPSISYYWCGFDCVVGPCAGGLVLLWCSQICRLLYMRHKSSSNLEQVAWPEQRAVLIIMCSRAQLLHQCR